MIRPLVALKNFGIIFVSLWPLLVGWVGVVLFFGVFLFLVREAASFCDSVYLAFSTALTLGIPDVNAYGGGLRIVELLLDFLGVVLWGIFASITMKAIEGAYE